MTETPINVLLIEDNPGDGRLIREMLAEVRDTPVTVECVGRLATGLERLFAGGIDVVLLDLSLPDSQGLETFVRAYTQAPQVAIIVLTGLADETLADRAVREGAQDYLVKGQVDGNLLIRSLRYAIGRKRAEAEVKKAQARLEHLLASSPAIIYTNQGSADFATTFVSENLHSIMGYSPLEMLKDSKFWPNHIHSEDVPHVLPEIHRLIAEGGGNIEYRFQHWDGHYRWIQDTFTVISDESGQSVEIVGSWADITERKRAEEALVESNRRLEEALTELKTTQRQVLQQERLRAVGQMASGIAHDFNNALMPILGYSELLLDQPKHLDDKEKVAHYLHTINTAAQDAASVVRRLREFYRIRQENETFLPVDLNRLVEEAITLTQPRWKDQALASGITIGTKTELQPVPRAAGNEPELREVLTNLIFNAADAMPQGGTLTVRTRPEADRIVLEVSDTGTGMTEEVRQRCLEPFFSTKGERGTGLGLAMVYGTLQRHQGTIDIQSEPGKGTSFLICLPVQTEEKAEGKRREAEALAHPLHILVVEDEPPVRQVVVEYLTGDGHTVEAAANGREGLEKFHAAAWFDVVVTDRGMPDMSGDQLAAAIKRVAPNKPVILLTGFGDLMEASGEKPSGVDFIASKPVTMSALRQALREAMAAQASSMQASDATSVSHDRRGE